MPSLATFASLLHRTLFACAPLWLMVPMLLPAPARAAVEVLDDKVIFSFDAPDAEEVQVTGSWVQWIHPGSATAERLAPLHLKRESATARWTLELPAPGPGSHQYKFLVDDVWTEDTENPNRVPNEYENTNSLFVIPTPPVAPGFTPVAGPHQLNLVVLDARTGNPVPHAAVVFDEPKIGVATTDGDGRFHEAAIANGTYRVRVVRTGYREAPLELTTQPGRMAPTPQRVALRPAEGPTRFPFSYNGRSPRRRSPAGPVSGVRVFGEFNRWQPGLELADPEGDGVWAADFDLAPTVRESDYIFAVRVGEGDAQREAVEPDPDSRFATVRSIADSHLRVTPAGAPTVVIEHFDPAGQADTPVAIRYIPGGAHWLNADGSEADRSAWAPPVSGTITLNGRTIELDSKALASAASEGPGRYGLFAGVLPARGEVSLTVTMTDAEGRRGTASVVRWVGNAMLQEGLEKDAWLDAAPSAVAGPPGWLADSIIYHAFIRSMADSDGDGIGDFAGMRAQLPRLAQTGFNTLLLMPVWDGPSEHGYTADSMWRVEADFGTDRDFREMVDAAHSLGIRVVLDFNDTATYTGNEIFGDAVRNPESPFRPWLVWRTTEDYQSYGLSGDGQNGGWPQFNYNEPGVRRFTTEALLHWATEYGVDGFRFDSADRLQPSGNEFWRVLRRKLKHTHPDLLMLGELYEHDGWWFDQRLDNGYDGRFNHAVMGVLRDRTGMQRVVGRLQQATTEDPVGSSLLRFLANHDIDRLVTRLEGDRERALLGWAILFTLPGTPALYYGEEYAMEGRGINGGNSNRGMLVAAPGTDDFAEKVSRLVRLRADHAALRNTGTCEILSNPAPQTLLTILRRSRAVPRGDDFVLAFNVGSEPVQFAVPPGDWKLEIAEPAVGSGIPPAGYRIWRGRASR